MAKFNMYSRYRKTDMAIVDGIEMVGVWNQPSYLRQRPNEGMISRYYVASSVEGRPDLIAQYLYSNALLDWVLIAFNAPIDPLNWPRAGETIEYPDPQLVYSEL